MEFTTTHKLDFGVADWRPLDGFPIAGEFKRFKVGTCKGLWRSTSRSYDILAITNDVPGNGHFEDVLEWFENSCKRDGRDLNILEVWNKDFKKHLIKKRGFKKKGVDDVVKKFI